MIRRSGRLEGAGKVPPNWTHIKLEMNINWTSHSCPVFIVCLIVWLFWLIVSRCLKWVTGSILVPTKGVLSSGLFTILNKWWNSEKNVSLECSMLGPCEHHVVQCHFLAGDREDFGTVVLQNVMSKIGTTTKAHHRLKTTINIHDSAKVCLTQSLTASHQALEIPAISTS